MNIELLKRKSTQIERALARVKSYLPASVMDFEKNYISQDIVYRNFQIVVQNCIDTGSHIISTRRWNPPRTMKEVFDLLSVQKVISPSLGKELRKMVTLRNIIVHNYALLDHRKAYPLIKKSFKVVPRFCLTVTKIRS